MSWCLEHPKSALQRRQRLEIESTIVSKVNLSMEIGTGWPETY